MTREELNRFLARLEKRIAPHAAVRNVVIPEIRSAEVFSTLEREFQNDILKALSPQAVDYIDSLSVNEYWFILMLAAALIRANLKAFPLDAATAQDGVFILRQRIWTDAELEPIWKKVKTGALEKLSDGEMFVAKHEGLVVWDVTCPHGDLLRINPALLL